MTRPGDPGAQQPIAVIRLRREQKQGTATREARPPEATPEPEAG